MTKPTSNSMIKLLSLENDSRVNGKVPSILKKGIEAYNIKNYNTKRGESDFLRKAGFEKLIREGIIVDGELV